MALQEQEQRIELWPVCVGWGDAIFVTAEKGEQKYAYLVDGGSGMSGKKIKDEKKVKAAYKEIIIRKGFELKRIIATHPDKRHTDGILRILLLEEERKKYSDILFTDALDENDITQIDDLRTTHDLQCCEKEFSCFHEIPQQDLFIRHESITAKLKLRSLKKPAIDEENLQLATVVAPKQITDDDIKNESSIITTIYHKTNGKTLACLTADGFFDEGTDIKKCSYDENDIIVFQVPLHGSKRSSTKGFYEKIAGKTRYYFISCGSHGRYEFPDAEVLAAIRAATISQKKAPKAAIVLTNGIYLTSSKVQSFTGHEYEPNIYYWDEKIYDDNPFLRIQLYPTPELPKNLAEWSIIGYKEVVQQSREISTCTLKCMYADNKYLMVPIVGKIQLTRNRVGFKGFKGLLPLPNSPCNWQNSLIMVDRKTNLLFFECLDANTCTVPGQYCLFRCNKNPWQKQYAFVEDSKLKWSSPNEEKPARMHGSFNISEWNSADDEAADSTDEDSADKD